MNELHDAVQRAAPHTAILLEDGRYLLSRPLDLTTPHVTIRSQRGRRESVFVGGTGMDEQRVGVAVAVGASHVTLADLTIGDVRLHGIQVRGENNVQNVQIHNVRVRNAGQQLLKGSMRDLTTRSQKCLVACCLFDYDDHAPSHYTNGVDVLAGTDWHVRDNQFVRIRGPKANNYAAGPAILFWRNSAGTVVERNTVVDCYRGIALGLTPTSPSPTGGAYLDHENGVIRNNVVVNANAWADEGIEISAAKGVRIQHNTVFVEGRLPWSISVRFPMTTASVTNNLTNRRIIARDGANFSQEGNLDSAARSWFRDVTKSDLRLADAQVPAIDSGIPLAEVDDDLQRTRRPVGSAWDVGAFEHPAVE